MVVPNVIEMVGVRIGAPIFSKGDWRVGGVVCGYVCSRVLDRLARVWLLVVSESSNTCKESTKYMGSLI